MTGIESAGTHPGVISTARWDAFVVGARRYGPFGHGSRAVGVPTMIGRWAERALAKWRAGGPRWLGI